MYVFLVERFLQGRFKALRSATPFLKTSQQDCTREFWDDRRANYSELKATHGHVLLPAVARVGDPEDRRGHVLSGGECGNFTFTRAAPKNSVNETRFGYENCSKFQNMLIK